MQKKLLFLGGSHFQLPPILYAKQQGHYIITCDYLPNNPGHKYADEYYNISTTDKDAVLHLAKSLNIDGVIDYASDPAAYTASYVAEKLGLAGNPLSSVEILTHKDLFRDFLKMNNFNVPSAKSFTSFFETESYAKAMPFPLMIKPVDSSGSKGVVCIHSDEELFAAFTSALSFSRSRRIIVEEFIERKGYQIAGDGFVVNGKLVFRCFAQEHFNNRNNPFAPIGESFPLLFPDHLHQKIHNEIERLLALLDMKIGALNFDIIIDKNDEIYLLEIGPRAGGHLISKVINYCTGVDLIKYIVDGALGFNCNDLQMYKDTKYYSNYAIHTNKTGVFKTIIIDESLQKNIVEKNIFVKKGDVVLASKNSGGIIGCLILKYSCADEMMEKMETISEKVVVEFL